MSYRTVQANGASHRLLISGVHPRSPVILLHGFPCSARLWERQMPALAAAGFWAIAPDLRGAPGGGTDIPKTAEDCSIQNVIVKDIAGIMDALSIQKAHIIGHDWGGFLAWAFAGMYPDRTIDLISVSVGHPTNYFAGDHIGTQKQRSWYILLFNVPEHGEKGLMGGALGKGFSTPEAAKVEGPMFAEHGTFQELAKPGAATAALGWYRANAKVESFYGESIIFKSPPVTCDTMQIWPTGDDPVCGEDQAKTSGDWVQAPGSFRYERLESPSHFAVWTDAERVSKLFLDFLQRSATTRSRC